ncbi:MAG TPA: tRNA (adenosine(37)-N6)-threonylcarbamoyltransferase complex ATPase subunit type 1 TsaE [Vicinamibacterales bacterium]|jgi:tRNA threonylcarbamoyladenosine biosynthesis protein TsaE|nr:tRNA (adenosine(37)-N6)-threonylcarbamoyltransferase complex ATPase subunit type 1 TsaE [Vicinamibacterales bacterium]
MPRTVVTHSEQETFALAEEVGRGLEPGEFVLLHGDLGAGKTVFVRGLAAGLGIDPDTVTSPTFVLIQHYSGPTPLIHADLYRLDSGAAVDDLGLEDIGSGGVVAVEWADRMPRPPAHSVSVTIEDAGDDRRRITIG